MNTISKLALMIAALAPAGITYAAPTIFDTDMSLYYEDKVTKAAINFTSSKRDTEEYKSSFFSWVDQNGEYYSCTLKDSSLIIPPRARTGSVSMTVDSNTWTCLPKNAPIPAVSLSAQCRADGLNTGTGTGSSRRSTSSGVRRYADRYHSNSASCQVSINGAAPVVTQGWLLNKQSKRIR